MDAVEDLFRVFPDPESDEATILYRWCDPAERNKLMDPLKALVLTNPVDLDHAYLKSAALELFGSGLIFDCQEFRQKVLHLSLAKPEIPDDGSAKSKQLQYYKWIGQGKKDSDRPFRPIATASPGSSSLAYLPTELMSPQACAACGKACGLVACTGCLTALDPQHCIFKTLYCSKRCQTAHWPQHKASCVSRKMIGRAAILLRKLFLLFRDLTYSDCVTQIQEDNGVLVSTFGNHLENAFKGRTMVRQFPRELASSEEDLEAFHTLQQCTEVFSTFKCIVDFFLDPICKQVEEVEIAPRNAHRPTMLVHRSCTVSCMLTNHFVLRVKLHSGEDVAVDLAGAQFGWKEPVAPWNIWEAQRVCQLLRTSFHGRILDCKKKQEAMYTSVNSWVRKVSQVSQKQVYRMHGSILDTIKKQQPGTTSGSAAKFLRLRDYDKASTELIKAARQALEAGLAEVLTSKTMRMYWTSEWVPQVTDTKEQSEQVLEKVWLSDAEYERNKHNMSLLKEIWMRRCLDKKAVNASLDLGLSLGGEHN